MANWVIRNSDGEFMVLDNGNPGLINTQPNNYTLVSISGDVCPDPRTTKWNGRAAVAKTAGEIASYDAAKLASTSQVSSREKNTLATLTMIVRAKGVAAWNVLTIQQKVDAILAEADVWKAIREFIDDKV